MTEKIEKKLVKKANELFRCKEYESALVLYKTIFNDLYVNHTGQSYNTIEKTLDRDYFMDSEEAKKFGIVDAVIASREESDEK